MSEINKFRALNHQDYDDATSVLPVLRNTSSNFNVKDDRKMNAAELEMMKRKDDAKEHHFEQMTYAGYMRSVHDGFFNFRRRQLDNNMPSNDNSYEEYMKNMHDAFFNRRMGG